MTGYEQGFEDCEDGVVHYQDRDPIAWEEEGVDYRIGYLEGWEDAI